MGADVLRRMELQTMALHSALEITKKADHLVVSHKVHGELVELYPEDYAHFLEIVRDALSALEA